MSVKITKIIVIFYLCIGLGLSQNDDSNKLANYFYNKCANVTKNTEFFNKIHYEAGELSKELSHAFQNLPKNQMVFCRENRASLIRHFSTILDDLGLCFVEQEKFLVNFMKASFTQFLQFLCVDDGENVNKFFKASATQCRSVLLSSNDDSIGNCFQKIFKPSTKYLAKKDICDDLNTAKKCFDVIVDENCPNYQPYKDLNSNLFAHISRPCTSDSPSVGIHLYNTWTILIAPLLLAFITYR